MATTSRRIQIIEDLREYFSDIDPRSDAFYYAVLTRLKKEAPDEFDRLTDGVDLDQLERKLKNDEFKALPIAA